MQNQLTHLTLKSSNKKVGPIPVSTSSHLNCPQTCPYLNNGCYADSGPLALHWRKVTEGERGLTWHEFLSKVEALPEGQLWRHNQAGDLLDFNKQDGINQLAELAVAARKTKGWTYTHHRIRGLAAAEAIRYAKDFNFTVNMSCETEAEVDYHISKGRLAVLTVPQSENRKLYLTNGGNRVMLCPQQTNPTVTCATCKLCYERKPNQVIAFRLHGTGIKKATSALANAQ